MRNNRTMCRSLRNDGRELKEFCGGYVVYLNLLARVAKSVVKAATQHILNDDGCNIHIILEAGSVKMNIQEGRI